MPLGPCLSEHFGDIYCIFPPVSDDSRLVDEIITGFDKKILRKLIPEERWYLSSIFRCSSCNNKAEASKYIKTCSTWISQEIEEAQPTKIITFGLSPYKFAKACKSSFTKELFSIQKSPIFGEFLCLPALYELSNSTSLFNASLEAIRGYIGIS
jgi:hypothetical protein